MSSVGDHLMTALRPLVDTVGLKAILLALAAICHEKALGHTANEPGLADNWQVVADDLESFAQTSLRRLR